MTTWRFINRAQWGAAAPKYRYVASMKRPTTFHWNGPTVKIGGSLTWDHSKCASIVRGIQSFHMKPTAQGGRGWSDIAYNFLMCPHGYTFEGRGINVINGANGTNEANRNNHAVCSLAGEGNAFPEDEKVGLKSTVLEIANLSGAPAQQAIGHRDHKSTACPGDERYRWAHAGMPTSSAPTPTPTPTGGFLMALTDAQQKEIHEFVVACKNGVPAFGVPALFTAYTEMYYSLAGLDLENKPSIRGVLTKGLADLPAKVVAKLPASSTGGLTEAQVKAAVKAAINEELGFLKPGS